MNTALQVLGNKMAERFGLGAEGDVLSILKSTAFKGPATDAQITALLIVANQYGLNPFTKEIFAFPDKNNGIVPVVGVDGWSRIMNDDDRFDGIEFDQDEESCTCRIYRKDRSRAVSVTEYMGECKREGVGPWRSHPKRMLRHKAMIQCARLAFGFAGIYDQDEAERIVEKDITQPTAESMQPYTQEKFEENFPQWQKIIHAGNKTADEIIAKIKTRNSLTDLQESSIRACAKQGAVYENA